MDDILQNPAATGLAGVFGTAFLAWLGNRLVGKAAIQTAVAVTYEKQSATFGELLDQLRTELRVALRERDRAREASAEKDILIEELRTTIHAMEARLALDARPT